MTHNQGRYIKPKNIGQKQVFKSPILEKLSRTHISIPLILFWGISAGIIYFGIAHDYISPISALYGFFIGLIAFTFVEYAMHRFAFHMEPDTKIKADLTYKFHGVHHEYPKDKYRLAMPPVASISLTVVLFFVFRLFMEDFVYAFLPGFLSGYAGYLCIHYIIHAFRPPNNFFKTLWVHHGIHHYKHPDKAFGVSSPLWDYIFRTMPPKK